MLYELRIYAVQSGRMGDIADRMLRLVPPLFQRHDIHAVAHWNALTGPQLPAFLYLIEWRDAAHRQAAWASFYEDTEWWDIRARTNSGHELVTSYTLWLATPAGCRDEPFDRIEFGQNETDELVISHVPIGQDQNINDALARLIIPRLQESGARIRAVLRANAGPRIPSFIWFVSWRQAGERERAWIEFDRNFDRTVRKNPIPDMGTRDVYLMKPATAGFSSS